MMPHLSKEMREVTKPSPERHGMFLFLLGMLTAFVEPRVTNVRMGLAAHLVGLTNGASF